MDALLDQSVLESLPQEQRQKLVKKARQQQINLYLEREKELAKAGDTGSVRRERRPKERVVHFNAPDRLRDAINNFYDKEGKLLYFTAYGYRPYPSTTPTSNISIRTVVQELLESGASPNLCSEATGITLLHQVNLKYCTL